jgi:hypothetical protein
VYLLTRQVTSGYTIHPIAESDVAMQQQAFEALLSRLGQVSPTEVTGILAERNQIKPESDLEAKTIARLQKRIDESSKNQTLK